jgi:hypothetical protein
VGLAVKLQFVVWKGTGSNFGWCTDYYDLQFLYFLQLLCEHFGIVLQISRDCLCKYIIYLSLNISMLYGVSQEEMSIFWEVIVSVILRKNTVYVHVSYSERFPRYSYFPVQYTVQTSNTPCPHTSCKCIDVDDRIFQIYTNPGGGRRIFKDGKIQGTSPPDWTLSCLTRVVNLLHVKEPQARRGPPSKIIGHFPSKVSVEALWWADHSFEEPCRLWIE